MNIRAWYVVFLLFFVGSTGVQGAAVPLDMTGVQPGPVTVDAGEAFITVTWPDETGRGWTAVFSLNPDEPLVTSIGVGGIDVIYGRAPRLHR